MRRIFAIAAAALLIGSLSGCGTDQPTGHTVTKPDELAAPEMSISGVPTSIEAGGSFTITVTSNSSGNISVKLDKTTVAVATAAGDRKWDITVGSVSEDTKVKITATQDESKGEGYAAGSVSATFKVVGSGDSGDENLPGPDDEVEGTLVTFTELNGEMVSPERGMYSAYEVHKNTTALTTAAVKSKLQGGNTLWLIEFYLTEFMTGNISQSYLDKIQSCFDAIRGGGAKTIVRFAYRVDHSQPELDQEPTLEIVLKHIAQVKPILQRNEDVLFCLQAGFIGTWGEWYYTTHISSIADRKKVCDALLDAVPASRQIQLRTPAFKMKMYNLALQDTITVATAHGETAAARLGGHNDCFGADASDEGTFESEDGRNFWKADTRYTIMGGETCQVSDYCLCPNTLKDLEDYHWTYLHDGYNEQVLARWKKDGCMPEIRSRLGYRLVLKDLHHGTVEKGKECKVIVRMYNNGFAAPMNPRQAWLVWVGSDGKAVKSMLGVDPRSWQPGYNVFAGKFTPSTDKGALYLELADPMLPDNPDYSMALANEGVFDVKTGYNKLLEIK